jgi:hypothetical protein
MSIDIPIIIASPNLSHAWGGVFLHTLRRKRRALAPVVVSVGGFTSPLPPEDEFIRSALDETLTRLDKNPSDVSAMTIFPHKPWVRRGMPGCREFSAFCLDRFLPRLKKLDRRNQNGTYFERMMGFTGIKAGKGRQVNQLEFVIGLLRDSDRRPRQSALQIACFDPAKDHTGQPVRGFPCLQQVSIAYDDASDFALNAYYPTQYVLDRAYGNYLGLCHLGHFLARETGLRFVRMTCFVGRPDLGDVARKDVQALAALVGGRIQRCCGADDLIRDAILVTRFS